MFNLEDLMNKAREMQENLQNASAKLDTIIIEAESGGGMVRAKVNANRKLLDLKIDPDIVNKEDVEMLEDLVTAAINRAMEMAEAKGKEEMQKGMPQMPNIPGMDFFKK
jgi:DNA-binding YbaB/EbfC family protein